MSDTSLSNRLAAVAGNIRTEHEAVQRNSMECAQHAYNAGSWLAYARGWRENPDEEVDPREVVPQGQWERWVEDVAGVPHDTAKHYFNVFRAIKERGLSLTDVSVMGQLAAAKAVNRELKRRDQAATKRSEPIIPAGQFSTIVIDPPWDMQKIIREVRPNQVGFDYPTMTNDELLAWPMVRQLAADDCHLFCWTTEKWLPFVVGELLEAWDFRYVLTMAWHKPGGFQPVGLPQFNCEFVVYGRRGSPTFIETRDFFCCFSAPRREHSRKPDEFYDVIRRVTAEPRIDVFSREPREGFAQFGNEIDRFADGISARPGLGRPAHSDGEADHRPAFADQCAVGT